MTTIRELCNLKGRRALVTGAMGNLGQVIADTLAEMGADLVLVDRPGTDFDSLSASLTELWGTNIECLVCDLEHQTQRAELIANLKGCGKSLNILISFVRLSSFASKIAF